MPFPNPDTQFKPGNPGRPRGRSITDRLRALLEKGEINGKPIKDGKQVADLITETILKQAVSGDYKFIDLILSRIEGPPRTSRDDDESGDDVGSLREHLQRLRDLSRAASGGKLLGRAARKRGGVRRPRGAD